MEVCRSQSQRAPGTHAFTLPCAGMSTGNKGLGVYAAWGICSLILG